MRGGRTILTSVASTALVVAASTGIVWPLRCSAAVLVAALVATGQRWNLAVVTASGLLGLVVVVGAGPASGASPIGLLAWAVPTWAVVLVAVGGAGGGASVPATKDLRVRLRLVAGQVAAGCASLPLVVVAAGGGRAAAGWSAAGALALCGLLLAATSRRAKASRPQAPGPV